MAAKTGQGPASAAGLGQAARRWQVPLILLGARSAPVREPFPAAGVGWRLGMANDRMGSSGREAEVGAKASDRITQILHPRVQDPHALVWRLEPDLRPGPLELGHGPSAVRSL
jgi:hypothetical protein